MTAGTIVRSAKQRRALFFSLRWRLLLVFMLLFMTALAIVFLWFSRFATRVAMENLQSDLRSTAVSAAAGIDGDAHAQLVASGQIDDATYQEISEFLRSVKRTNPKASGIYTYIQRPGEADQIRFVVSAALPPGATPSARDLQLAEARPNSCSVPPNSRPDIGDPYSVADGMTQAMQNGLRAPSVDIEVTPDRWGQWMSGFAPIRAANGEIVAAVGVDMCAADIITMQQRIRSVIWLVFGIVFVVLGAAVFFVAYRITRPIVKLTVAADAIGRGEYEQQLEPSQGRLRDEVDALANVFALMVDKVRERETKLKQQVAELQIMVDDTKRKEQVDAIVDSDFFRDLQAKAREARARRNPSQSEERHE